MGQLCIRVNFIYYEVDPYCLKRHFEVDPDKTIFLPYFKRNYEAHDRILRNCKAGGKKIRNFEAEIDGKLRDF